MLSQLESCLIPGSQLPVQTSELRRDAATACNSGKKSKEDEKLWTRKGRVAKQFFFFQCCGWGCSKGRLGKAASAEGTAGG